MAKDVDGVEAKAKEMAVRVGHGAKGVWYFSRTITMVKEELNKISVMVARNKNGKGLESWRLIARPVAHVDFVETANVLLESVLIVMRVVGLRRRWSIGVVIEAP